MSNFKYCPARNRIVEAGTRQINGNVFRSRNPPCRNFSNPHFSVNESLLNSHTHQVNLNYAHSQAYFLLTGKEDELFNFLIANNILIAVFAETSLKPGSKLKIDSNFLVHRNDLLEVKAISIQRHI